VRLRRRRVERVELPALDLDALGITPAHERYPCIDGEPHVFNIDEGDTSLGVRWQRCRCGGIIMTERGAT
jgi:hypothetical protein